MEHMGCFFGGMIGGVISFFMGFYIRGVITKLGKV
jgi:hypothetical protein